MPIDPKKIEEYRTIESDTEGDTSLRLHLYQQAVPALLAEREELIALLREVEWADNSDGIRMCVVCAGINPEDYEKARRLWCYYLPGRRGHTANCELGAFLKGTT